MQRRDVRLLVHRPSGERLPSDSWPARPPSETGRASFGSQPCVGLPSAAADPGQPRVTVESGAKNFFAVALRKPEKGRRCPSGSIARLGLVRFIVPLSTSESSAARAETGDAQRNAGVHRFHVLGLVRRGLSPWCRSFTSDAWPIDCPFLAPAGQRFEGLRRPALALEPPKPLLRSRRTGQGLSSHRNGCASIRSGPTAPRNPSRRCARVSLSVRRKPWKPLR